VITSDDPTKPVKVLEVLATTIWSDCSIAMTRRITMRTASVDRGRHSDAWDNDRLSIARRITQ
jgi:hypothetical protein